MLRKVLEECKRKESTWKRKEERQRRKAKEARETMRDCWVKMDKVAEACNEIAKSGNEEEEEEEEEDALDGGDDAKEVEQQKQESVARDKQVYYTHLRDTETSLHLECRLQLEKKIGGGGG